MSEQKTITGKLKEVDLQGKTAEEWAKEYCKVHYNIENLEQWVESWIQQLMDKTDVFIHVKGHIFEILEFEDISYEDYCVISRQPNDGTYTFCTSFYNGGTHLCEMLEETLDNIISN